MSSIYGFWQGPTYRPSTRDELFGAALEQPMSLGATFWDQAKGGVLESFGLGTAIRSFTLPPAAQTRRGRETDAEYQARQERVKGITEEEYKASPYFRENVPWDSGMTEDRAAALATMNDAKRVREYFAEKRPITSFFGNLAGQATDPINYIPVAGPTVRAAAVARMGVVKGIAATAALDAAANTAIAGLATRETRRGFGDDVSWQMMVSEIATAALLGTAFGTVGGVLQRRAGIRADALRSEAEVKVNTLRATQEARIALNEAIGGLANDGEVRLSPNGVAPIERVAGESPTVIRAVQREGAFSPLAEPQERQIAGEVDAALQVAAAEIEPARAAPQQDADPIDAPARDAPARDVAPSRSPADEASPQTLPAAASRVLDEFLRGKAIEYTALDGKRVHAQRIRSGADHPIGGIEFREDGPQGKLLMQPVMNETAIGNFISGLDVIEATPRVVDASPARPEPLPTGRAEAEAKVAKPENYKALADQYRVDPEAGTFPEEAELRQLAQAGRLSDEDMAVLDDADAAFQDGAAYGEALKATVNCLI